MPMPVAARSKAVVCGRSFAVIASSNPRGGMDVLSLVNVECCQVEISATGRALVQRSPTECVCVCHWLWSGETVTLYNYNEWVEGVRLRKKEIERHLSLFNTYFNAILVFLLFIVMYGLKVTMIGWNMLSC
jgi:hypothetical protein